MNKEMKTLTIGGNTYEIVDEKARNSIPTKTSELENDSGFITKADIPTDESYELIGETPFTLAEKSNIKLESAVETTYEAKTPTVWNFDDVFASGDYTLAKCTLERENDHYKLTSGSTVTGWYQSYLQTRIPVEIGKTYTLCWDNSASKKEYWDTATDWGGAITGYDGDTSTTIISTKKIDEQNSASFTSTTGVLRIRYAVPSSHANASTANIIARFNSLWLNEGEATPLTEIYNINGIFNGSITLQKVPKGATVTATPTAKVYKKAPTDKTLSKADTPADAQATGERIEKVKNLLPLYGKTIVNFGDSIFGNAQPPVDISTHLANKTGATVYNCGFGGCRMTPHERAEYAAFSMCNLSTAIATNDFTLQENAVSSTTVTLNDAIKANFARLKTIDFSNVDIVTIAYGTNDYHGNGATLDNEENLLDVSTFGGALRYSIETLLNKYPNLRIFILSITYRFWTDENNEFVYDSHTHANNYGKFISDYNAKLKEVAEEYNLPFVDDYNIGIGKFNRYQYFPVTDGTHQNETGRKLIASHLAKELY